MSFNKRFRGAAVLLSAFILLNILSGCMQGSKITYERKYKSKVLLNTVVTIYWYDGTSEEVIDECFDECARYEQIFSRTIEGSDIYRLNTRNISEVSEDTAELLQKGLYYSALSNGAFDITVGTLTELWRFGENDNRLPSEGEISEALKHVGYEKVSIEGEKVFFSDEGTKIDLGAIAKGYIADKLKEFLLEKGVKNAIINLGGNTLCIGQRADGEAFKVGIQYPFGEQNDTIAVLEISDMSVVSSGIYERYFELDGKFYHHILDPQSGYPYDNNLLSVSIISDESVDGDALSTVSFALGLKEGMKLIDSIEGVYAIFITDDYELHFSEGLLDDFNVEY